MPARDRIVGRDEELGRLRSVLSAAGSSSSAAVVVASDAGAGKTALVEALAGGEQARPELAAQPAPA